MKRYKLFLIILSISISLFGQKDNYSSFTDGNYIVDGLGVSKLEYERYKDNLDDGVFSQNYDLFGSVRSLYRNDVFDIHIDFDDVDEAGCSWGVSVAPADRYSSVYGITFQDGANVIDECGNFGVSGHSSPKFLSHYETATPGDVNILFDEPVIRVQINAGKSVTITMTAYDENDNILDESSLQGTSELAPISVETDGIRKVVISGNGIYVLDDLMVQTQNLRGTFQGDYYSAHTIDSPIELSGNPNGLGSGSYTLIDDDGTIHQDSAIDWQIPDVSGTGYMTGFILKSDWFSKRPKDMEIVHTNSDGSETVIASWTHPEYGDGCFESLEAYLEGSDVDCTADNDSYSTGYFDNIIFFTDMNNLRFRVLSAYGVHGVMLIDTWGVGDTYCDCQGNIRDCNGICGGSLIDYGNHCINADGSASNENYDNQTDCEDDGNLWIQIGNDCSGGGVSGGGVCDGTDFSCLTNRPSFVKISSIFCTCAATECPSIAP